MRALLCLELAHECVSSARHAPAGTKDRPQVRFKALLGNRAELVDQKATILHKAFFKHIFSTP